MVKILGDFIECNTDDHSEFLVINFSATSVPLQQRWRNNGLSADFLADYLTVFFPGEDHRSCCQRAKIKDGVSFVANELLENAMKFNYPACLHPVTLYMGLKSDHILFYVTNCIDPRAIEPWIYKIKRLLSEDTDELFMEQLIKNGNRNNADSGLGYLSMINDWNAKLAWKFEDDEKDANVQKVTVMVKLPF